MSIPLAERAAPAGTSGAAVTALVAVGIVALVLAGPTVSSLLPPPLVDYPRAWIVPVAAVIGDFMTWLAREAAIGPVRVADVTRGLAALLEAPIDALVAIFATGWTRAEAGETLVLVPPLPWVVVIGLAVVGSHRLGGRRLALVTLFGGLYLVLFGFWRDAMATLANVLLSTLAAVLLGVAVGAFAFRRPRFAGAVEGLMNVMQTVPVFAYLVPTLLFLGYGPSAALVATVVYALPPMVHATLLGLKGVPAEVIEFGRMAGASKRQLFWKIELPVAVPALAVGINQAIMASLNMVVIASMIGAGGLGYIVLLALRKLDIGAALEAGLAIVVLAVVLDRTSLAAARLAAAGGGFRAGGRHGRAALAVVAVGVVLAVAVPAAASFPEAWRATTAPLWNALVSWINVTLFTPLDAIRSFTLIHLMNPVKQMLLDLPWVLVVGLTALAGFVLAGIGAAATVGGLLAFVAVTGYWDPAVVSVYLIGLGVLLSLAVGLPIGYLVSGSARAREWTGVVLDTLQTLPTLVYLLPAVMLFRNGDFSALLAVASYAVAPAVRYAMHGFAAVPGERVEAARMCGASRWQVFKWVRLPSAFPTLLLGLNQTIMMAIAMLVITALVGTRDLGQQVFIALSRAKVGEGIVAGLAVAALALTADLLVKAWARRVAARDGVSL